MTKRAPMDEESYKKFKIACIIKKKQRSKFLKDWYHKFPNENRNKEFLKNSIYFE